MGRRTGSAGPGHKSVLKGLAVLVSRSVWKASRAVCKDLHSPPLAQQSMSLTFGKLPDALLACELPPRSFRPIAAGPGWGLDPRWWELNMEYKALLRSGVLVLAVLVTVKVVANIYTPNLQPFADSSGTLKTFSSHGALDLSNPFFQDLGTNGRSCSTCHAASDGWSVSVTHLQERFQISNGFDPIFRLIDGATCPDADVSTLKGRAFAYSLLLNKGLIRMSLPVPEGPNSASWQSMILILVRRRHPLASPSIAVPCLPPICASHQHSCGTAVSRT
jgi:hypothetical protein